MEPLCDDAGSVTDLAYATFDITRRKPLESSLQESRRRYATVERLAWLGHFVRDFENDRACCSSEIYRIFGLEPQNQASALSRFLDLVQPKEAIEFYTLANKSQIDLVVSRIKTFIRIGTNGTGLPSRKIEFNKDNGKPSQKGILVQDRGGG